MIEPTLRGLSVGKRCALPSVSRSSFYDDPKGESEVTLDPMRVSDKQFLETPFYGVRRMTWRLRDEDHPVNEKRILHLHVCAVDESKEAREDRPGQRRLGHVEDGIAGMPHHPGAGLDRPLAERGRRPALDPLRCCRRTQGVGEVAGQGAPLESDYVCRQAHA